VKIFHGRTRPARHVSTGAQLASLESRGRSGSGGRLDRRPDALTREADLHDLAAERFLALGEVVRAERERATANRLRDEATRRRT
jgi:hypothetical protein